VHENVSDVWYIHVVIASLMMCDVNVVSLLLCLWCVYLLYRTHHRALPHPPVISRGSSITTVIIITITTIV
jgi:hypothetical protein